MWALRIPTVRMHGESIYYCYTPRPLLSTWVLAAQVCDSKRTWRIIIIIVYAWAHQHRKPAHVALCSQWSQWLILVGCFKIKTLTPVQRSCQADSLCLPASDSGQTWRLQRNKWRFGVELRGGTTTPMLPRFKGLDSHWGQYRDICCHGNERCSG